MKQGYGNILFAAVVISVVIVLFAGSLSYIQTNSPTVFVKQLAIRTQVLRFINGGGNLCDWSISLTNEGRVPITAIGATLMLLNGSVKYVQNSFLIVSYVGPPATSFVRNPPLPFVSTTDPLFFNDTASNSVTISSRGLAVGESIPVVVTVTYANGTLSEAATSAHVVFVSFG
ncbi:MAG: hypothetical protein JRM80_06530 [Nitrososphaerota archaeon]|nr:hypothetical protein [Nitrososphaerota archaeon]